MIVLGVCHDIIAYTHINNHQRERNLYTQPHWSWDSFANTVDDVIERAKTIADKNPTPYSLIVGIPDELREYPYSVYSFTQPVVDEKTYIIPTSLGDKTVAAISIAHACGSYLITDEHMKKLFYDEMCKETTPNATQYILNGPEESETHLYFHHAE